MSDDLYQKEIIDLAKKARTLSRLDQPDRTITIDNPLCGDRVTLDLAVNGTSIADFGHKTRGCLLCEASAFLIASHIIGQEMEALEASVPLVIQGVSDEAIPMGDLWPGLESLAPVRRFKSRHDCVTLPFQALIKLLNESG